MFRTPNETKTQPAADPPDEGDGTQATSSAPAQTNNDSQADGA